MKVIIPVAGIGSRLKPHTFSTPKPLLEIAGRSMLSYILDEIIKLNPTEIIFIVGHLKDKITNFVEGYLSNEKLTFIYQEERNGDGGAIKLALDHLKKSKINEDDDVFIIFGDTLIDFNIKRMLSDKDDYNGIVFTKEVEEPQHYGVVYTRENDLIYDVIEKPENPESNLAIIGAYWFKSYILLKKKIDEIFKKKITSKGEYKLADAIKLLVKSKSNNNIKAKRVIEWFDCGRPEVLLNANRYLLTKKSSGKKVMLDDSLIISPSYVSKTTNIYSSIIGPYTSISNDSEIKNCIIKNSIIGKNVKISNMIIEDSIIGDNVVIENKEKRLNIGEKSIINY